MRRSTVAGALFAAGLLLSAVTPITSVGAAPTGTGPVGAKFELLGSGTAHSDFTFDVADGKNVQALTITVAPGEVVDWGASPASVVAIMKTGALSAYGADCAGKEMWQAGHAYPTNGSGVVKNEEQSPAELIAFVSNAPGAAPAAGGGHDHGSSPIMTMEAAAGCPTGPVAKATDTGAGLSVGGTQFTQSVGKQVAVYHFTLEPGYSSDWHTHPGKGNAVIQTVGTVDNWTSCTNNEVWKPGYTYFHAPGHAQHENMTNNTSKEPAELVAILFDIPEGYPTPIPPVFKAPPPADCPGHLMTSQ